MNVRILLFSKDKPIASCCNVSSGQTKVSTLVNQIVFGLGRSSQIHTNNKKTITFHQKSHKYCYQSWLNQNVHNLLIVANLLLENVRMRLRLPKWGLGSPLGLLKVQSSIVKVKTPRIEAFFISLKNYRSVDVENDLAWVIWTFAALVMGKRKANSQTGSLTPTTKSQESTRP
jgi:hypothetical protein